MSRLTENATGLSFSTFLRLVWDVARPKFIELGMGRSLIRIPILHEDRSVLAIDKPANWMLIPYNWQRTQLNLQAALVSSIRAGDFWARSRNLKFLRYIHRLDAETTGVMLFGKSLGAVNSLGELFEDRRMEKRYLAVVKGVPRNSEWSCRAKLAKNPKRIGRMMVDAKEGKSAETHFRVLQTQDGQSLIEANPLTGRTHQIRVHLLQAGHTVIGDPYYGPGGSSHLKRSRKSDGPYPMGLRSVEISYMDPFRRKRVHIEAPIKEFMKAFGFSDRVSNGKNDAKDSKQNRLEKEKDIRFKKSSHK